MAALTSWCSGALAQLAAAAGLPPAGPLEWVAALERARAALRGMVTGAWEAKLAANGSTLLDAAGGAPRGPPVCDLEKAFDAVVARLDPRVFRGSPFAGDFLFRVVDEAVEQHVQHDGDGAAGGARKRGRGGRSDEGQTTRQQKKRRRVKRATVMAVEKAREEEQQRAEHQLKQEQRRGQERLARERQQNARQMRVAVERARQDERVKTKGRAPNKYKQNRSKNRGYRRHK